MPPIFSGMVQLWVQSSRTGQRVQYVHATIPTPKFATLLRKHTHSWINMFFALNLDGGSFLSTYIGLLQWHQSLPVAWKIPWQATTVILGYLYLVCLVVDGLFVWGPQKKTRRCHTGGCKFKKFLKRIVFWSSILQPWFWKSFFGLIIHLTGTHADQHQACGCEFPKHRSMS